MPGIGVGRHRASLINRRLRYAHGAALRGDKKMGGRYGDNYVTGVIRLGDFL